MSNTKNSRIGGILTHLWLMLPLLLFLAPYQLVKAQISDQPQRKISFKLITTFDDPGRSVKEAPLVAGGIFAQPDSREKVIRLWDDVNGKFVQLLEADRMSDFSSVIVKSDDNRIVAVGDNNRYVRVWDVQTGKLLSLIAVPSKKLDPVFGTIGSLSMSMSPDGKHVATGRSFSDRHVTLWEASTAKTKFFLENPGNEQSSAISVEFSPDGKILAGVFYNRIVLWEVETGKLLKEMKAIDDETERHVYSVIYRVRFSPDGRLLAASNRNGKARLWDIESGKIRNTLEHKNKRADVIEFSRDGKLVATGSNDKTVKLWDVETGKQLRTLKHKKGVIGIHFSSPELGLMIVTDESWGDKKGVYIWDIVSGTLVVEGGSGGLTKDGKRIFRQSREHKKLALWEIVIE